MNRAILISLLAVPVFFFNAQAAATAYTRALNADGAWFAEGAWNGSTWTNPTSGNTATAAITTGGSDPLTLTLDQSVILSGFTLGGTADLILGGISLLTGQAGSTLSIANNRSLEVQTPLDWSSAGITLGTGQKLVFSGGTEKKLTSTGRMFTLGGAGNRLEFGPGKTTITSSSDSIYITALSEMAIKDGADVSFNAGFSPRPGANNGTSKSQISLVGNAKLSAGGASAAFYLSSGGGKSQTDFTQDGGEVNVTCNIFRIGHGSDVTTAATYTLNSGTFIAKPIHTEGFIISLGGPGELYVNGGAFQANKVVVANSGGGSNTNPGNDGKVFFNGGTATFGSGGITTARPAQSIIQLDAATFTTESADWAVTGFNSVELTSAATGATFAPKVNRTISLSSPLTGSGRLVLDGEGKLLLNATSANSFTGGLEIRKGTLAIGAADQVPAWPATLSLTAGCGLELAGIAAMTLNASSTALTLNGGTLGMKIAQPTGSDQFQVAALSLGETETTLNLTFGSVPPGVYTLIQSATAIANPENINHLSVSQTPAETAIAFSIGDGGKSLILTVTSLKALAWCESSGTWAIGTGQWDDLNHPASPRAYSDDYSVTFGDLSGVGQSTVSVAGSVSPLFMAFNNNSTTAYTFTDGGSGQIILPGSIGLETAEGGKPVAINVPLTIGTNLSVIKNSTLAVGASLTITESLSVSENAALTLGAPFGTDPALSPAIYNGSLTVETGATFTLSGSIEQTIDTAFSGSGTIVKSGTGTLNLNKALTAFSGQIQANGGLLKLNTGNFFQNTAYLSPDVYPLLIGENASVFLYAGAINAAAGMVGGNFARLATGATLQHDSSIHNQQSRIRVDGDAKIINGSGYNWTVYPAAVFEVTAGTAEFSENAVNTGGAVFALAAGSSANDRVTFDVAPNAAFVFTSTVHILGNSTLTGIRKRGGGTLTIEKESTRALPVAGNYATGVFSFDLPFDVEAGRLTLNRTNITGTGIYTVFNGAVIGGSGVIGEGGTLAAKSGGAIETGLTTANLMLETGATIAVTAEPATLATTGALTLPDPTLVNADAVSLDTYGKFCDVLTWTGEAPAARFTLAGAKTHNFYLVKTASSVQLWRRTGILISLY